MELNRALPRLQALLMHMLLTALAGTRRDKYVVLFLVFFEANSTLPLLALSFLISLFTLGNLHSSQVYFHLNKKKAKAEGKTCHATTRLLVVLLITMLVKRDVENASAFLAVLQ